MALVKKRIASKIKTETRIIFSFGKKRLPIKTRPRKKTNDISTTDLKNTALGKAEKVRPNCPMISGVRSDIIIPIRTNFENKYLMFIINIIVSLLYYRLYSNQKKKKYSLPTLKNLA
jgi:hypothetical protein